MSQYYTFNEIVHSYTNQLELNSKCWGKVLEGKMSIGQGLHLKSLLGGKVSNEHCFSVSRT